MTRLGRADLPALHPGIRARLVDKAVLAAAVVLALVVVRPAALAAPADTTGTVVGWARDSLSGKALPYASVTVLGTHLGAMADTSGWFRIARVPAGERMILARAHGFRRGAAPVRVRPARTDTVWLRLRALPYSSLIVDTASRRPRSPNHR